MFWFLGFFVVLLLLCGCVILRFILRDRARDRWLLEGRIAASDLLAQVRLDGLPQWRIFKAEDDPKYAVENRDVSPPYEMSWYGPRTPPFKPTPRWRIIQKVDSETEAKRLIAKWTKPKAPPVKICFDGNGNTVDCGADDE